MAGITKAACIGLILKYIGGLPLIPALRTRVEGAMPAKQIGIPFMGLSGLSAFTSVLNGVSVDSIVGNVFQNPIADLTGSLTSSIGESMSRVNELVGDGVTGVLTSVQGTAISDALNSLKSETLNLESLTDKISGVKLPNYSDFASEFGLQEVSSVMGMAENLKTSISTQVDQYLGNFTEKLDDTISKITEPLNFNEIAKNIDVEIKTRVDELALRPEKFDEVLNFVNQKKAMINGLVENSVSSMNKVMDGSTVANQIGMISETTNTITQDLYSKVVKPEALKKIAEDNKIFQQLVKDV